MTQKFNTALINTVSMTLITQSVEVKCKHKLCPHSEVASSGHCVQRCGHTEDTVWATEDFLLALWYWFSYLPVLLLRTDPLAHSECWDGSGLWTETRLLFDSCYENKTGHWRDFFFPLLCSWYEDEKMSVKQHLTLRTFNFTAAAQSWLQRLLPSKLGHKLFVHSWLFINKISDRAFKLGHMITTVRRHICDSLPHLKHYVRKKKYKSSWHFCNKPNTKAICLDTTNRLLLWIKLKRTRHNSLFKQRTWLKPLIFNTF